LLLTWQDTQGVGVGDTCMPVRVKPVTLWLKDVRSVHAMVSWQLEQLAAAKAAPAVECTGLLVVFQSVR